MRGDLGEFLAEGGAIVGGGAAMGATFFFIAGSVVHDFRSETDLEQWARNGALLGGVFGLVIVVLERVDSAV